MPLSSRREEIERFISGAADVCVATDVLGHGVNLPCETLLFAETTKFDGEERRDLLPWELAQIAGRAGRFGLVERGHVGVLAGLGWGTANPELVESALEPHVPLPGGHLGYRAVDEARIRPQLADLGVDDPLRLDAALVAWHRVALREWASESWLAVESLQPLRLRLQAVQRRLAERGRQLSLADTWKLVNAPVDEDDVELLATLALAIAGDRVARPQLMFLLDTARLRGASLEDAERAGREASILRWFALQYPMSEASPSSGRRRSRTLRPSVSSRGCGSRSSRRRSDAAARADVRARPGSRCATAVPGSRPARDMNSP